MAPVRLERMDQSIEQVRRHLGRCDPGLRRGEDSVERLHPTYEGNSLRDPPLRAAIARELHESEVIQLLRRTLYLSQASLKLLMKFFSEDQ